MIGNIPDVEKVRAYSTPIIPLAYKDAMSYLEQVRLIKNKTNELVAIVNGLRTQTGTNTQDINNLQTALAELDARVSAQLEDLMEGKNVPLYIDALSTWIDNNLQTLVGRVVKYVFFGLTDDGYFVAYIPDSWDFIRFDTCIEPKADMYGHLIMQW